MNLGLPVVPELGSITAATFPGSFMRQGLKYFYLNNCEKFVYTIQIVTLVPPLVHNLPKSLLSSDICHHYCRML